MCYANAVRYISGNEDSDSPGLSADELSDVEVNYSYGLTNAVKIQKKCVAYILRTLGTTLHDAVCGGKRGFSLESALLQAQSKLAPTVSTRTLRRWVYHYYAHGETRARTQTNNRRKYAGGIFYRRVTKWDEKDTDCLRWILKFNEQFFLDEIFGELYVLTGIFKSIFT